MWTINEVKEYCGEISKKVGDEFTLPVYINSRLTRTLGRVRMTTNRATGKSTLNDMEISKQLLETCDDSSIRSVIEHEWCHYYVTKTTGVNHGHDSEFKAVCARIGCTNDGVSTDVNRTVSTKSIYKYEVFCPNCGSIDGFSRMCSTIKHIDTCHCNKCRSNQLYVVQNW